MKKIIGYFLQGILIVAPLGIITYVIYVIFSTVDGWVSENISSFIGFSIPGLGLLIVVVFLTFLGFLGQTAIVRPLLKLISGFIKKIPLLNLLYSSLNDLFSAFVGKEKKFNTPVKVLFNEENELWKIGFLTKENMEEMEQDDLAAVYFPHSYNFSGELYLVPRKKIKKINLSPAEVMKFIVSGGVTNIDSQTQ